MAFGLETFNLGSLSGVLFGWLNTFFFWFILALIFFGGTWGALIVRKRRKLVYPCHIDTDLGAGKIGREITKAGWFKSKTMLGGLFDYGGEERLKTKDRRIIQNASAEDFQEIGGKRGICCVRKGDDPEILVPINKMTVVNLHLLEEIAPADYRDASVKIIKDSVEETRGKYDKLLNVLMYGSLGIIFLICIIMIVKMVKEGQISAQEFSIESMRTAKDYCVQALASNAP